MIFDAECVACGKRKGIELPYTTLAEMAIHQCKMIGHFKRCECGGVVNIQVYEGKIDEKRNIINRA